VSNADSGPHRPTRASLSRELIVDAAVALIDERGPDELTMRSVAARLGAGTMSLYRHVSGRDELLDLALAAMAADIPATAPTGDWRADLMAAARDVRAGLLRRPHLTVLLTSRTGRGQGELPALERTLGVLRQAGFGPREAVLANHALGNYVAGAALFEAIGLAGTTGEEREARRRAVAEAVRNLPSDAFPNLGWVGEAIVAGSLDERFEFGLGLLLDGMEALRARQDAGAESRDAGRPTGTKAKGGTTGG
jgi:AcrR family transcriptional regulator